MSKARTLANFISDNNEFADGTISVAEVSGAAPLASPSFTGNVGIGVTPATFYGRALHVHDTGTAGANIRLTDSNSGTTGNDGMDIIQINNTSYIINREAGGMNFYTGGELRYTIQGDGTHVFNENSLDNDFRVESDANTHAFFLDASVGNIGLKTTDTTAATLTVNGTIAYASRRIKNTSYSVPTATFVDIYWEDDTTDLNSHYIYKVQLSTTGTSTPTGAIYWVYYNGSGWATEIESRNGDTSNHPLLQVSGTPARMEVYHNHPSTYSIRVNTEAIYVGGQYNTQSSLGLAGYGSFYGSAAGFVGNEQGYNQDFRIESDNSSHMLFMDASSSRVGIGTNSPQATFVVAGTNGVQNSSNVLVVSGGTTNGHGLFKVFNNSGAAKFRVDAELGRVGINNDSPSWTFDAQAGAAGQIGTFYDTGTNGGAMYNGAAVLSVSRRSNGGTALHGELFRVGRDNSDSTSYNVSESFFTVRSDSVVVNESSNSSLDFRVESDNNANALFVDASEDMVKVATSTTAAVGTAQLQVGGLGIRGSMGITTNTNTGIPINQGASGGTALIIASRNYGAGTATQSQVAMIQFYYDGNNTPTITHIAGTNGVVSIGTNAGTAPNETLTLSGSGGNTTVTFLMNT